MDETISTLFYNMANSCFEKNSIAISDLKEGVYILFQNRIWRMLVCVKKVLQGSSVEHSHLLVDVEKSEGCAIPSCSKGVKLCGVDKRVSDGKTLLYNTPFLRAGEGMSLTESSSKSSAKGQGLFYELGSIFIVDYTRLC